MYLCNPGPVLGTGLRVFDAGFIESIYMNNYATNILQGVRTSTSKSRKYEENMRCIGQEKKKAKLQNLTASVATVTCATGGWRGSRHSRKTDKELFSAEFDRYLAGWTVEGLCFRNSVDSKTFGSTVEDVIPYSMSCLNF